MKFLKDFLLATVITTTSSMFSAHAQQAKPTSLPFEIQNETLNVALNPNGKEAFITIPYRDARRSYIGHAKRDNGGWTVAEPSFFTSGTHQETMPVISRDGKKLVFFSNRPYEGKPGKNDFDAFFCVNVDGEWSKPAPWTEINSDSVDYFGSFATNGNFYFTSSRKTGEGQEDIWVWKNETARVENVGQNINTPLLNSIPAIAPDESYMIFFSNTKLPNDYGRGDLYISFKNNGTWSKPQNLGNEVNSEMFELSPVISPDGETFYFVRATPKADPPYHQWHYNLFEIPVSYLRIDELRRTAEY